MIKAFRKWMFRRRVKTARRLMDMIDERARLAGMSRAERRQMWVTFIKSPGRHSAILDLIEKRGRR